MKVIFHFDLDSYFVSASITKRPELKGKPVAITTGQRRSIIAAASYEAKDKGVYVPMPFYRAKKLVPDLIPLEPNYALYTNLSSQVFELIANTYTKNIEVASIDECYIDVTNIWKKYGSPYKLAQDIQKTILQKLNLPSSIGISHNRFLAKMSSPVNKPFGITITKPGDFKKKFGNFPINKYFGIGKKTTIVLNKKNIFTINDLSKMTVEELKPIFGIRAQTIIDQIEEKSDSSIYISNNELKGISNSITFQQYDSNNYNEILSILKDMTKMVSHRAIKWNQVGTVVAIAIKEKGGLEVKRKSKQRTLNQPIQEFNKLWKVVKSIFDELWDEQTLKFVGVSLGHLCNIFESTYQPSLFEDAKEESKIDQIMRNINTKFKERVVFTTKEQSISIKKQQNQSRYIESDRIIKHWDLKK